MLDLGANDGYFSELLLPAADYVVAVDHDPLVVDRLYRRLRDRSEQRIVPLVIDLADPSGGVGWRARERRRFVERVRPDLVLCLALIHHLAISESVPLEEIVAFLAEFAAELVIEFPRPHDEMVQLLMRQKKDKRLVEGRYTVEGFDFSGTRAFDAKSGYRSKSFLTVPLKNHENEIIGVLQLLNATDPATGEILPFSASDQRLAESLASQAAVALTNRMLINQLEELFESFINLINLAIDDLRPASEEIRGGNGVDRTGHDHRDGGGSGPRRPSAGRTGEPADSRPAGEDHQVRRMQAAEPAIEAGGFSAYAVDLKIASIMHLGQAWAVRRWVLSQHSSVDEYWDELEPLVLAIMKASR